MIYIPILYSKFTPIYYSSIIESPEIILHPNKSSKARKKGADDEGTDITGTDITHNFCIFQYFID